MTTITNGMRLAKNFGTSAEFWMGLHADFDVATTRSTMSDVLARIVSREATVETAQY